MKRILIFSDTHGDINHCLHLIETSERVDAIIHAGDYVGDAEDLKSIYPNIPIYNVKGNNDIFTTAPLHMTVVIDGIRIYITHGHEHYVKYDSTYASLCKAAAKANPDLIVFGHTHIPYLEHKGSYTLLNSGSTRFSHSYAIAEIENGKLKTTLMEI